MATLIIVGSLSILIGLSLFFWKTYGPYSGRAFGNRLAKHLNLPRSTFWYLLDNGAKGSALDLMLSLERHSDGLDSASRQVAPTLQRGLERLEARFGTQGIYEQVKPIVARWAASPPSTP